MEKLYISYAEQRRMHGVDNFGTASRFISEIPPELIEEVRPALRVSRPVYRRDAATLSRQPRQEHGGVHLGQRVRHRKFGEGVVLSCEGAGAHARVQVNFETSGTKWLVMSYAGLELM
jgi:DNA helicase-2/ATP-dependent DNA helicase PcrA